MNRWVYLSFFGNAAFALLLSLFKKKRAAAVIPLSFSAFPLAFGIMALCFKEGLPLKNSVHSSAEANGLDWKFLYDIIWVSIELLLCALCMKMAKCKNPFPLPLRQLKNTRAASAPPAGSLIWFLIFLFIGGVGILCARMLLERHFPAARFFSLLRYQIPFAVLMGVKEELFFRWHLLHLAGRALQNRLAAALVIALVWGVYHGLFAIENIGVGFFAFFWCAFVSLWWSLLVYRNHSLYATSATHIAVEFYGFYLMYMKYL